MTEQMTTSTEFSPVPPLLRPGAGVPPAALNPVWAKAALSQLSRREREILPLLAARWTDQEIADALCISYRTVTTHVAHIFDKLGINSRRAAAAFAQAANGALD